MVNLAIDVHKTKKQLVNFIRREIYARGFKRAILGLSGGLDSSVVAYLSSLALGKKNIWAIKLPYKRSHRQSFEHAQLVINNLGINTLEVEITPMIDAYFKKFPQADNIRRGNKMARERMSVLYDLSVQYKALVVGTGNKSEILLGYGTLFGDTACAINPVGDLYKTQMRQLARSLGVPEVIIKKPPTADLWPGQEDEKELGFTYEEIDRLLYLMVDKKYDEKRLIKAGFKKDFIKTVSRKIKKSQFKREMSAIAKLTID
jgi:NAD+ synthase